MLQHEYLFKYHIWKDIALSFYSKMLALFGKKSLLIISCLWQTSWSLIDDCYWHATWRGPASFRCLCLWPLSGYLSSATWDSADQRESLQSEWDGLTRTHKHKTHMHRHAGPTEAPRPMTFLRSTRVAFSPSHKILMSRRCVCRCLCVMCADRIVNLWKSILNLVVKAQSRKAKVKRTYLGVLWNDSLKTQ